MLREPDKIEFKVEKKKEAVERFDENNCLERFIVETVDRYAYLEWTEEFGSIDKDDMDALLSDVQRGKFININGIHFVFTGMETHFDRDFVYVISCRGIVKGSVNKSEFTKALKDITIS